MRRRGPVIVQCTDSVLFPQTGRQTVRRLIIFRHTCMPAIYFGHTCMPGDLILGILVEFFVYNMRVSGSPGVNVLFCT